MGEELSEPPSELLLAESLPELELSLPESELGLLLESELELELELEELELELEGISPLLRSFEMTDSPLLQSQDGPIADRGID